MWIRPALLSLALLACVDATDATDETGTRAEAPPDWLVLGPLAACDAPAAGPTYADVGEAWGLGGIHRADTPHAGGAGAAVADLDQDGDLDVALAYVTGPAQVFWRDGDAYTPGPTLASGETGASGFGIADHDADGDLDLGVTGGTTRLAWNENEGGAFTDVTAATIGRLSDTPGYSAPSAADWDRDGDVDLYLPVRLPTGTTRGDQLLENDGSGVFTDVSDAMLPASAGALTFQGLVFDADNDLYPELYGINDQGNMRGGNAYLTNQGGAAFTSAGDVCGCAPVVGGMSGSVGDVDGDGWQDLYLGNSDACNLLINDQAGGFYDIAAASGSREMVAEADLDMVWGSLLFDHDNDGDLDILAVHGDLLSPDEPREPLELADSLLSQQADGTFVNVAPALGLDATDSGRSVVVDDWNADGVLDLLVTVVDDWPHLYVSESCTAEAWLEVELRGPAGNPQGVGARVEVLAGGRSFVAAATHQSGLNAARETRLHFGLGAAEQIEGLRVYWPDGGVSETDVAFGARRRVVASR